MTDLELFVASSKVIAKKKSKSHILRVEGDTNAPCVFAEEISQAAEYKYVCVHACVLFSKHLQSALSEI
jgi:hypothetical protein